jgi:large subunit ribosomal protein L25
MKTLPLKARKRTASGKGGARQIRAHGGIPAIIYGEQAKPTSLEIDAHEFAGVLQKSTSEHILVDIMVEGGDGAAQMALIKEVQHDPITEDVLHVDFQHIHPTKAIRVTIPVRLTGIAEGVKNFGGILQHTMRVVEAEGLPADLPDVFEIDVTSLNIHEAIHVRDLSAEGVTIVSAPQRTIATVVPPTVVKEVAPTEEEEAAAAEAEEGAEPAEGEEKKEGEEATPKDEGEKGKEGEGK